MRVRIKRDLPEAKLLSVGQFWIRIKREPLSSSPSPVLSMRLAVLTLSPNKQYRGILIPTTPATHEPEMKKRKTEMGDLQFVLGNPGDARKLQEAGLEEEGGTWFRISTKPTFVSTFVSVVLHSYAAFVQVGRVKWAEW